MSIFKDENDKNSSKRAVGLSYAALGIVMVLAGIFTDKSTDFEILLVVVGTALTALGISEIKKPFTRGTVNPDPKEPPPPPNQ